MVTTDNGTTDNNGIGDGGAPAPTGGKPVRRSRRLRGGLVTIITVLALLTAMGLTVLGLGAADNAVASYDASSWLWSAAKSEIARVNGITGRVDTRLQVPQARSHAMQVAQTDQVLMLRDLNSGLVSALNLATLQIVATTKTTAGIGVNVVLDKDSAFVVDAVQGLVRQLDPRSLAPIGEPVHYPPGITGGAFDGEGRLWIGVPSQGTVSAVTAAPLPSAPVSANGGSGGGVSPAQVRTEEVAAPSHDLVLATLDDGVAVLDRTSSTLTTVHGEKKQSFPLQLNGPGDLPPRINGNKIPVTVADGRRVYVVAPDGTTQQFTVPGEGGELAPAVAWSDRFYCTDETTGTVYSIGADGKVLNNIDVKDANGPLELEVREGHLFINAPNSANARVVDDKHAVREVNKYANDILGGDPPPKLPPPPPPKKPRVSKPSAPRSVTASAGNAEARVSWRPATANGSAITKYVVEGANQHFEVGANQRSLQVTGLTNGETYRFSVYAVNAKGAGPAKRSNPVVPTSEVPDAPVSVTAQAQPDGTVRVNWPAANGQGYKIAKYAVTAVSAGANAPAGESTKNELVIPAGELEYGNQYAFSVIAVNEKGAGSKASPVSNSVVPFNKPDKPLNLAAQTVKDQAGTVNVTWDPAPENGRPITKYVVDAGGRQLEVTDPQAQITGLGDGENVTIKVQAVNEAGAGLAASTTARTVAPPRVTITGSSATTSSVTVKFTVEDGGGVATCSVTPAGEGAVSGNCSSITVNSRKPSTSYSLTVTARNAAGTGTGSTDVKTGDIYGVATCKNGSAGEEATYCNKDKPGERNGNEIFSVPEQINSKQVGWAEPGTRLKAYCKKTGDEVYAYIYNNEKRSTLWIQVDYEGKNYIPWAWFNLEGGDKTSVLPNC